VLTYHGAGALTGTDSGPFRPASPLLWLILWPASIALGWVLLDRGTLLNSLFLPAHVVAAFAAGGLLISAVVARTAGGPGAVRLTWRAVLLCWAWGAMGATVASLFLEAVADGIISLSFLARSDAFEGVTSGEQLRAVYEQADEHLSQRELLAATLMLFSVSPPLVEESMKAIGVRLAGRRSLSSYQAFVLGVACGVGFGTLEAVLYGVSALQEDPGQWWSLMLLRGGATSMHALASGLFGLAVYFAVCHRWRRTAAFIAAAMLIHGAWNGLTVIAVSDALPLLDDLSERQVENLLSVVLGVWSLVNVAILVLTARVLAGRPVPPIPSPHAGDTRKGSSLRDDATFGLPQSRMLLVEGGVGQGPAVLRDTARRGRSPRHPQRSRP
jgi:RsiW-degrading membrane proteinase PrsW (M82 family)